MSANLADANPILAERYLALANAYARRFAPWFIRPTCVYRTPAQQAALFSMGRNTLDVVNDLRVRADLPPITADQNHVVTWTMRSRHTRYPAEAIDVVAAIEEDHGGTLKVRVDFEDLGHYRPLVVMAERFGLVSGGSWKSPDWAHLELPPRPTIEEV